MNDFSFSDLGPNLPGADSLVATGTAQATAFPLTSRISCFTSVFNGSGAKLPFVDAHDTLVMTVLNRGVYGLLVYPTENCSIEGLGLNNPVTVPAGGAGIFYNFDAVTNPGRDWTVTLYSTIAGLADAPTDGNTYGRYNGTWNPALPLTGGTLTGPLILSGNATQPLQPVTLQQASGLLTGYLPLSGGTMTGQIVLVANALAPLNPVPLQQLQAGYLPLTGGTLTGPLTLVANATASLGAVPLQQLDSILTGYLPIAGGNMTGALMLSGDPTAVMGAATKHYVDAQLAAAGSLPPAPNDGHLYGRQSNAWQRGVALTGDTMVGMLTLFADPVNPLDAVTKEYVDSIAMSGFVDSPQSGLSYGRNNGAWVRVVGVAGDVMTGPLQLSGNATAALQAVPYQQLQSYSAANSVPIAGGTMTGPLILSGNATAALQAVPYQQLQSYAGNAAAVTSDTAPSSPFVGQLWFDTVGLETYIWYNDGNSIQWVPLSNYGGTSFINALDYGAKGDGTTDDTTALQNALNAGAANGLPVLIPNTGHNFMVNTLQAPSNTYLMISGTLQMRPGQTVNPASGAGVIVLSSVNNVTILGSGTIDGNGANTAAAFNIGCVQILSSTNVAIRDVTLKNAQQWNLNVVNSHHVLVDHITSLGGTKSSGFVGTSTDCWITDSYMQGATNDMGFAFYGGVSNSGAIGNVFYGGYSTGVSVFGDAAQAAPCSDISIDNNVIRDNGGPGVAVTVGGALIYQHSNITISNNQLWNNNTAQADDVGDMLLQSAHDLVINGNLLARVNQGTTKVSGIRAACPQITITNNVIKNVGVGATYGVGIALFGYNDIFIAGNHFYDDQATPSMQYAIAGNLSTSGTGNRNVIRGNSYGTLGSTIPINLSAVPADIIIEDIRSQARAGKDWMYQGAMTGWNVAGNGMTNFVNSRGAGPGGFTWYNTDTNSAATPTLLATLDATGNLTTVGGFSTNGGVSTNGNVTVNGNLAITGTTTLGADPASALQAATKQYVDAQVVAVGVNTWNGRAGNVTMTQADVTSLVDPVYVNVSGDTMTGTLTLAADPTTALQAATKQYADTKLPALGVTDGSSAAAGHIGEYVSAAVTVNTAITNNTNTDLTTISLTAGDWSISGQAYFQASASSGNDDLRVWVNTVSVTQPTGYAGGLAISSTSSGGLINSLVTSPLRLNITATTTVYLSVNATYGTGTMNVQGLIAARRMR